MLIKLTVRLSYMWHARWEVAGGRWQEAGGSWNRKRTPAACGMSGMNNAKEEGKGRTGMPTPLPRCQQQLTTTTSTTTTTITATARTTTIIK